MCVIYLFIYFTFSEILASLCFFSIRSKIKALYAYDISRELMMLRSLGDDVVIYRVLWHQTSLQQRQKSS